MNSFNFTVFCLEIVQANSVDPDQKLHCLASERGLLCLHMSLKQEFSLKGLKGKAHKSNFIC